MRRPHLSPSSLLILLLSLSVAGSACDIRPSGGDDDDSADDDDDSSDDDDAADDDDVAPDDDDVAPDDDDVAPDDDDVAPDDDDVAPDDDDVVAGDTVLFDFEGAPPTLSGFGGGDTASVVTSPTDPSDQVGEFVKSATAEVWAGTTVSSCDGNSIAPLPFTATETSISVDVWSPAAGIPILLKVEDSDDPKVSAEVVAAAGAASAWSTLTFDLSNSSVGTLNPAETYDRISIFFDFGTPGTGSDVTYYADDFTFLGAVFSTACP